jgi:hypothetical protein
MGFYQTQNLVRFNINNRLNLIQSNLQLLNSTISPPLSNVIYESNNSVTYSATDLLNGYIIRKTNNNSTIIDSFDSASNIINLLQKRITSYTNSTNVPLGTSFICKIYNNSNSDLSFYTNFNQGIIIGGNAPQIASQNTATVRIIVQNQNQVFICISACTQKEINSICSLESLNTVANYLRNYMPEFRNLDFWAYTCDGNGYNINDGGNDMYDTGNYTTPWLLSDTQYIGSSSSQSNYPFCISYYQTGATGTDTNFNYVSLGYIYAPDTDEPQEDTSRHPITVLGSRCDEGPVGWQVGGNIGADGSGIQISNFVYSGALINSFTVYAGYRQVYDASDPTICSLVILLGHSSWGSVFGPVSIYSVPNTSGGGFYLYAGTGSKGLLGLYTLLSKPENNSSTPIPDSELETIIFNFTLRIKQALNL